jgi:nucleoside-diphosphate-sugar epimerase
MLVAITGGSGFIGRHLVDAHLKRGDAVRLLSRTPGPDSDIEWVQGDLMDPNMDLRALIDGVDVLYHCAAELSDEAIMPALHIDGTRRLVDVARGNIGRWVQLSSVGAYGRQRDGVIDEGSTEDPVTTYEITKTRADSMVAESASKGDFESVILRPSIVYGLDMPNSSLFKVMSSIKRKLFFYIGSGEAVINYISVAEVVNDLIACATHPKANGKTYIASHSCGLEQAVESLARGLGVAPPKRRLPERMVRFIAGLLGRLPGFPLSIGRIDALTSRVVYNGSRIHNELDLDRSISVEDGFYDLALSWRMKG